MAINPLFPTPATPKKQIPFSNILIGKMISHFEPEWPSCKRSTMKAPKKILGGLSPLAILLFASILISCQKTSYIPLTTATIVGIYGGQYDNGMKEKFVIKPDHTFEQTCIFNGTTIYSHIGKWEINPHPGDTNVVSFYDVILGDDIWKTNGGKPYEQSIFNADWDPYVPLIAFAPVGNYVIKKQNENEPTGQP